LTAPTGTAVFNIRGLTLHSALLLHGLYSTKLSADTLNTLRSCIGNLTVLVIDEISMVGANMLIVIDLRLRQITSRNERFGGISVMCFGDLFQLPPLKTESCLPHKRNAKIQAIWIHLATTCSTY